MRTAARAVADFGLAAVALAAVALAAVAVPRPASAHEHGRAPAAGPGGGASIYEIDAAFADQHGARVRLDVGRGHPVLVTMLYASCRDACPLLLGAIRRIEAALPARARADLRVVVVTLDPAHDTPDVLRSLAAAHGADAARWHFLRGGDDGVREVAAVLGIKYRRLSTGVINHSSVITLLDRAGVIDARVEDPGQPTSGLVERLRDRSARRDRR